MKTLWIPALVLLLVPAASRAEERSESALRAEIAAIDGRLRGIEETLEERVAKDARMSRAREECDRLDTIFNGYRERLRSTQQAVNRAHQEYCRQWRLSSILWPCRARRALWWFCDLSYAGRISNWKLYGPYAESFTKARNEFWARRDTYEAEKRAVATELPRDTELLALGLGAFDDYFAFRDAYLERKTVCDGTVRAYFADRQSLAELRRTQETLRQRRALLEEELGERRGDRRPGATDDDEGTGRAQIQVLWPLPGDLGAVPLQDDPAGAKGLPFRAEVVRGQGVVQPGRLYRLVAQLGGRAFTVYGRADSLEGARDPVLTFRAILPTGLGPFELRLSAPDTPGIRPASVRGSIVAPSGAMVALDEAKEALLAARTPEPGTDPVQVQRSLARAYADVADALMRLDRMKEALRAADQADAIVKKHWPASRRWVPVEGVIWLEVSWLRVQDALARGDLDAVERLHLERAGIFQQVIAEERGRARGRRAAMYYPRLRDVYRRLGDHVVLLSGDLRRAREHWRKGRTLLHAIETDVPRQPEFDPVWFAP